MRSKQDEQILLQSLFDVPWEAINLMGKMPQHIKRVEEDVNHHHCPSASFIRFCLCYVSVRRDDRSKKKYGQEKTKKKKKTMKSESNEKRKQEEIDSWMIEWRWCPLPFFFFFGSLDIGHKWMPLQTDGTTTIDQIQHSRVRKDKVIHKDAPSI